MTPLRTYLLIMFNLKNKMLKVNAYNLHQKSTLQAAKPTLFHVRV